MRKACRQNWGACRLQGILEASNIVNIRKLKYRFIQIYFIGSNLYILKGSTAQKINIVFNNEENYLRYPLDE
jgi:hypothetical protein